ncbi:MAG: hypothetical protein WC455_24995 [Dehalococcoidia bacterium]|jgi:hypothetical protein
MEPFEFRRIAELLESIDAKLDKLVPPEKDVPPNDDLEITLGELVDLHTKMRNVPLRFKRSDYREDEEYRKAMTLWKAVLDSLEVEDYSMTFQK